MRVREPHNKFYTLDKLIIVTCEMRAESRQILYFPRSGVLRSAIVNPAFLQGNLRKLSILGK